MPLSTPPTHGAGATVHPAARRAALRRRARRRGRGAVGRRSPRKDAGREGIRHPLGAMPARIRQRGPFGAGAAGAICSPGRQGKRCASRRPGPCCRPSGGHQPPFVTCAFLAGNASSETKPARLMSILTSSQARGTCRGRSASPAPTVPRLRRRQEGVRPGRAKQSRRSRSSVEGALPLLDRGNIEGRHGLCCRRRLIVAWHPALPAHPP